MIIEWQALEDQLSRKARSLQIDLLQACNGNLPEAQGMRALDGKIALSQRRLSTRLAQIRNMQATTLAGAIAKVSLGLEAQGKYDWRPNARELMEEGVAELQELIARAAR